MYASRFLEAVGFAAVQENNTVKPPIGNPPMAEHTADTEQFPWSQYATSTYRIFQLRNNFILGTKNVVPNPFLVWSFYCSTGIYGRNKQ